MRIKSVLKQVFLTEKENKKLNKKEYQQITIHTVTSDDIKFAA